MTNNATTANYSYDSAGNVTFDGANNYSYDAEGRLVAVNSGTTAQYGYDHLSRRVKKVAAGTTTHYVWEAGRVLAEHSGATGAAMVDYIYAAGRLIAKQSAGTRRYFNADPESKGGGS